MKAIFLLRSRKHRQHVCFGSYFLKLDSLSEFRVISYYYFFHLVKCPQFPTFSSPFIFLSKWICPSSGKHSRHAFYYALKPQRSLCGELGILHPVHKAVKHRDNAVVVLCSRDFIEEAVHAEGQHPALLTQHCPSVEQVLFVAHYHYGDLIPAKAVSGGFDLLNQPADGVKAGSVTDAVDQDEAICPLDLLMEMWGFHRQILQNKTFNKIAA